MAVAQYTETMLANIPSLYGITLTKFYDQMLLKTPASHRFRFISTIIHHQRHLLPSINWSNGKCDQKSQLFRRTGNECFARFEFVEALKWYNKALCHASSLHDLGVCYANRSAAYYALSIYKICLENIEFARKCILSERIERKLHLRQMNAQHALLEQAIKLPPRYMMVLSRAANPRQPFYINCLSKQNEIIVTSEVLQSGEVISLEKPYCQILSQSHVYERCTYCLTNRNFLSMIPCPNCSSAMFCNETCYGMAHQIFHRFECSIIDGLFHFLTDSMYLAVRVSLTSLYECNGSMDEYYDLLTMCFDDATDPFDVNLMAGKRNGKVFLMMHNLRRSFNFSMAHHVATVIIADKLKSNFGSLLNGNAAIAELFSVSIFHMLQISQENDILLEETAYDSSGDVGNDITVYGRGLFPFASNFKMSCSPNVLLLNDNGTLVGVTLRTIRRNESIKLGIMSRNHFLTDKNRRNDRMWTFNGRWCHCVACENDYDLYTDMSPLPPLPLRLSHLPTIPMIPEKRLSVDEIVSAVSSIASYLHLHSYDLPEFSWEMGFCVKTMIRLQRQLVLAYGTDLIFTEYSNLNGISTDYF